MTMQRQLTITVLTVVVLMSTQVGVVAAETDSRFPESLQEIECPELTEAIFNESLAYSDWKDCKAEKQERSVKRELYGTAQSVEGLGNWTAEQGEGLQKSGTPGVPEVGKVVSSTGHNIESEAEKRQRDLAS